MKKWYVMETVFENADAHSKWKLVDDVRFLEYEKPIVVAVVRDHLDDRLFYCVHPALVKCVEVKD